MADARLEGTQIADSVIDLIGGTPLVRMKRTMEVEPLSAVLPTTHAFAAARQLLDGLPLP